MYGKNNCGNEVLTLGWAIFACWRFFQSFFWGVILLAKLILSPAGHGSRMLLKGFKHHILLGGPMGIHSMDLDPYCLQGPCAFFFCYEQLNYIQGTCFLATIFVRLMDIRDASSFINIFFSTHYTRDKYSRRRIFFCGKRFH